MDYAEYKHRVVEGVAARLKCHSWYRGCCLDTTRDHWEAGDPVEQAIDSAEVDTWMWDGPGWCECSEDSEDRLDKE